MNFSVTVTVNTWVAHCKNLKTESDSMLRNRSDLELMQQEHSTQNRIRTQLYGQTAILLLDSIR